MKELIKDSWDGLSWYWRILVPALFMLMILCILFIGIPRAKRFSYADWGVDGTYEKPIVSGHDMKSVMWNGDLDLIHIPEECSKCSKK